MLRVVFLNSTNKREHRLYKNMEMRQVIKISDYTARKNNWKVVAIIKEY